MQLSHEEKVFLTSSTLPMMPVMPDDWRGRRTAMAGMAVVFKKGLMCNVTLPN